MTTIYLIRHSEPLKKDIEIKNAKENILIENEKMPLSVSGEKLSEEISNDLEFSNLDVVWSSNYVRAMATAKYFASNNNLKINVSDKFNERVHGVISWSELPYDFELKQYSDENYKIGYGESKKEVRTRMFNELMDVLNSNKGKRIAIVTHSTAIAFLLSTWCEVVPDCYKFKDKVIFDGNWKYCEVFKLEFNDNELIDIKMV